MYIIQGHRPGDMAGFTDQEFYFLIFSYFFLFPFVSACNYPYVWYLFSEQFQCHLFKVQKSVLCPLLFSRLSWNYSLHIRQIFFLHHRLLLINYSHKFLSQWYNTKLPSSIKKFSLRSKNPFQSVLKKIQNHLCFLFSLISHNLIKLILHNYLIYLFPHYY